MSERVAVKHLSKGASGQPIVIAVIGIDGTQRGALDGGL